MPPTPRPNIEQPDAEPEVEVETSDEPAAEATEQAAAAASDTPLPSIGEAQEAELSDGVVRGADVIDGPPSQASDTPNEHSTDQWTGDDEGGDAEA